MDTVIVHSCYNPRWQNAPPERCKCRKKLSVEETLTEIEKGMLQWETNYEKLVSCSECSNRPTVVCSHCQGKGWNPNKPDRRCVHCALDYFRQNPCEACGGLGDVHPKKIRYQDGKILGGSAVRRVIAQKTPRVATIDNKHILYAYVDDFKWAQDRINIWGELANEVRAEITTLYYPPLYDPFEGMPVLINQNDQRTPAGIGKFVDPEEEDLWT